MKKVKLLLMAVIGILTFSAVKVNAAYISAEVPAGIKADIQKFEVYVYNGEGLKDINNEAADKPGKRWNMDVDGIVATDAGCRAYVLKNRAVRIANRIEIQGGYDTLKSKFEETVKKIKSEKSISGGKNNKYFVTMNVVYKLTLPSGITNVADIDGHNIFSQLQTNRDVTSGNQSNGLLQMLISAVYDSSNDTFDYNAGKLQYGDNDQYTMTTYADDIPFFDEFYLFPNENINGTESYRFFVHTKATDEELLRNSNFTQDLADSESSDVNDGSTTPATPDNSQKEATRVQVPNTAASDNWKLLLGISILSLGSGIVLWELRKIS